ncbi:MAG TPA: glycerol-3-phosphate dehydrogenase/oxidase [Verrucomicrobiae bacterium]|jgi:glycerol-3-phosphate dehydrogenase|nr:glycerol-3-phosphate dehydrogenase/oxidase [Verrucomicrobiae bacterium]
MVQAPLDLLVIGGGIVGAGVARDAAMRGLRVGLVEQRDFASGTSSHSSRLLHGGMRYLAQGRIGLVHEASVEKKIIHQIAPHLAEPLPFLFPTYRTNKNWRLWQLKIGVKIYDLLCGGRNLGKSTWLTPEAALQKAPELRGEDLTGAVRYFDGFTNDARLVLDTLRSAETSGAMLLNYCHFSNATRGEFWECEMEDALADKKMRVRARTVVNATGPWADGLPHSRVKLRPTKGVHLVVDRQRVSAPDTVVMTDGKRILFAIPWGERTILGTTDTDYNGPLDRVQADASDISYILNIANQFFPRAKLAERDVISTWAGLRPLIANASGAPSDISRSHEIRNPEPGWWDVAGGKLTTYRLMAEQTVNQIVEALNHKAQRPARCRTAHEPLLSRAETDGVSGILPPPMTRDVVKHFCEREWAVHLDDVMIRRTSWHYYFTDATERAEQVAGWMSEFLGWAAPMRGEEIARYHAATGCQAGANNSPSDKALQPNVP